MKIRTLIAATALAATMAATATDITVGSYNIRVKTSADTGVHSWDRRKEYVALTVTDNDMDVVGFNEVISSSQMDDLMGLLPDYEFCGYFGHENNVSPGCAVDLVAFRRDKFDLLDSGYFFLNRNLTSWEENPWDNSGLTNVRHTSWAKIAPKGTNEAFYVFCTHLDHQGNVARMLQSHLNLAMMRRIAGQTPHIMVGDQNSTNSRVNYLNIYNANFEDAFIETNAAERYGDDPATSGQWNADPTSGRRIDYIWSDGFEVLDYNHCINDYDLGARPSDHIAITAKLRYVDPDLGNRRVYVKAGSNGDGTIDNPFGTIVEGISKARRGDTIFVAAGDYEITKAIAIDKTVKLFGGYNDEFTDVTGLSKIIATAKNIRCINQKDDSDLEIRHFGIYNGNLTGATSDGAGIMAHGKRLIARYCEIADCQAGRDGGGIDATGQLILDHVRLLRNKAVRYGGGVCTENPTKRYWFNMSVTNCYFEENSAVDGSAVHLPRFIYGYAAYNTFTRNEASDGSTLYLHAIGTDNNLGANLAVFNNTFTLNTAKGENGASAILADIESTGNVSVVCNTIVSNSGDAPAVRITSGKPFVAGNIVALNEGGDLWYAASSVSASHNLYTCATSISNTPNSNDLYSTDYAASVEALSSVLDCEVVDGKLIPRLSVEEPADAPATQSDLLTPPPGLLDYQADASTWGEINFQTPTVKIMDPKFGASTLCKLSYSRLRESTVHGDFNFDCMEDAYLQDDQTGRARPSDNTATFGACEYVANSGIMLPGLGNNGNDDDATAEYFNLQGMKVNPAAPGIYLRRQGNRTDKVVIR